MADQPVEFIQANKDQLIAQARAEFETLTGKQLQDAQTETILLKTCAYLTKIAIDGMNGAARNMLVRYSVAPFLDLLAELVAVVRQAAVGASCTLEFSLVSNHTGVTIPAGTRVQSQDGKVVFQTKIAQSINAGTYVIDIPAETLNLGVIGNGYTIGAVNVLLDPLAFVQSVSNTTATAGGADAESDDQLRERIKLAPNAYSTAGSKEAYKFHTLSAHPSIVDAAVLGPNDDVTISPGEVHVFPLVSGGGTTPSPVITAVQNKLTADKVRPLNDVVVVASPTGVSYDITVGLYLLNSVPDGPALRAEIEQMLNDYAQAAKGKLGVDVTIDRIKEISMQSFVYSAPVTLPAADVVVTSKEYANIGTVTVTIAGYTNG